MPKVVRKSLALSFQKIGSQLRWVIRTTTICKSSHFTSCCVYKPGSHREKPA